MTEKVISGYLVIHWKDESLKVRKTKPSDLSPYQIALDVNLTIEVPEVDTPEIAERLVIPQPTVEGLVQEQVTDIQREEWMQEVDMAIQSYQDAGEWPPQTTTDLKSILGEVLLEVSGAPDPEEVLEYLEECAKAAQES